MNRIVTHYNLKRIIINTNDDKFEIKFILIFNFWNQFLIINGFVSWGLLGQGKID